MLFKKNYKKKKKWFVINAMLSLSLSPSLVEV